jgi:hypothetical protein
MRASCRGANPLCLTIPAKAPRRSPDSQELLVNVEPVELALSAAHLDLAHNQS